VTANAITVIHSNKRDTVCQQQKKQNFSIFVDGKKLTENLRKVKYKDMKNKFFSHRKTIYI